MISDCDVCMIDDFSLLKTAIATDYYFKIIKKTPHIWPTFLIYLTVGSYI